jgi:tRNA (mo5U34)-methyltransferase
MDSEAIRARRDSHVNEHGPFVYNVRLAPGLFTTPNGDFGTGELLIHSVTQAVADVCRKPLEQLRVLDLGCHEGGYAVEFGLHGATVVGVEGRLKNVVKAQFIGETLGLQNVRFVHGDVRDISEDTLGRFDVVLCLGILYHLEAADAVRLLERCHSICDDVTVIRSAIGLSVNTKTVVDGHDYRGRLYREDVRAQGASLDNPSSILPSRASLLNLLSELGYTSVVEILNPAVPTQDDARDSITVAALKGAHVPFRSLPEMDSVLPLARPDRPGPAWLRAFAHPQQGVYWRVRERLLHSFERSVFGSRRPLKAWREMSR